MKVKHFIAIGLLAWFILGCIFSIFTITTYKYDVDNCNRILSLKYQIPEANTVTCVKIMNSPIYSYYFPNIFGDWFGALIISALGTCIACLIWEANDWWMYD